MKVNFRDNMQEHISIRMKYYADICKFYAITRLFCAIVDQICLIFLIVIAKMQMFFVT